VKRILLLGTFFTILAITLWLIEETRPACHGMVMSFHPWWHVFSALGLNMWTCVIKFHRGHFFSFDVTVRATPLAAARFARCPLSGLTSPPTRSPWQIRGSTLFPRVIWTPKQLNQSKRAEHDGVCHRFRLLRLSSVAGANAPSRPASADSSADDGPPCDPCDKQADGTARRPLTNRHPTDSDGDGAMALTRGLTRRGVPWRISPSMRSLGSGSRVLPNKPQPPTAARERKVVASAADDSGAGATSVVSFTDTDRDGDAMVVEDAMVDEELHTPPGLAAHP